MQHVKHGETSYSVRVHTLVSAAGAAAEIPATVNRGPES